MADALTGKTAKKSYRLAAKSQATESARLAEEERKVAAVEDGQRRIRQGGRGFLAFIEESGLADQIGQTADAGAVNPRSASKRIRDLEVAG